MRCMPYDKESSPCCLLISLPPQEYLELRHLVHYAFARARRVLSPLKQAALTLASLLAFQAVDVSHLAPSIAVCCQLLPTSRVSLCCSVGWPVALPCPRCSCAQRRARSRARAPPRSWTSARAWVAASSEADLVRAGRWLSDADRVALDHAVLALLRRAPGDGCVSPNDAFDYQNHLIVHWLNGNSLPVFRSEVFCQLRVHDTIRRADDGSHWI